MWNGKGPNRRYRYPCELCFHTVAALKARIMPELVSPIFMLDTSIAITGCGLGFGLSCIVRSFSVVCPWNVGVISSVGLSVSSVIASYGW